RGNGDGDLVGVPTRGVVGGVHERLEDERRERLGGIHLPLVLDLVVRPHLPLDEEAGVVGLCEGGALGLGTDDDVPLPLEEDRRRRGRVPLEVVDDLGQVLLVDMSDGGVGRAEVEPVHGAHGSPSATDMVTSGCWCFPMSQPGVPSSADAAVAGPSSGGVKLQMTTRAGMRTRGSPMTRNPCRATRAMVRSSCGSSVGFRSTAACARRAKGSPSGARTDSRSKWSMMSSTEPEKNSYSSAWWSSELSRARCAAASSSALRSANCWNVGFIIPVSCCPRSSSMVACNERIVSS